MAIQFRAANVRFGAITGQIMTVIGRCRSELGQGAEWVAGERRALIQRQVRSAKGNIHK